MAKSELKHSAQRAALEGKPIEFMGLKLWAITMENYEEWMQCRNVWMARQSKFPVSCISMPFLEALFTLDMDSIKQTGKPAGLLYDVMHALGMALGLGRDCVKRKDIRIWVDEEEKQFRGILAKKPDGEWSEITPGNFDFIRKIVLWMNGEEPPDESENDELLDAERELAQRAGHKLKYSLMDLEASVALAYRQRIRDVMGWSILEFEVSRRAIQRDKRHMICGIGETNGCKWEHGNPCPSWCYDRDAEGSGALIAQSEFGKAKAKKKE